jgi:hypothetical protein
VRLAGEPVKVCPTVTATPLYFRMPLVGRVVMRNLRAAAAVSSSEPASAIVT